MARICGICGGKIPSGIVIDGRRRNLKSRSFCLECSPFGLHNTKKLGACESGYKVCSHCGEKKKVEEFAQKNSQRRQSWCRPCLYSSQKQRWKDRKKDAVIRLGGKCSVCGYAKNYSALGFHHKDKGDKEYEWTKLRLMANKKVLNALEKCQLMCANCHFEFHYPQCVL